MTKRIISVRLSNERLGQLDAMCEQLNMNRSQVIDAALRFVPEVISGKAELHYDPQRLKQNTKTERQ